MIKIENNKSLKEFNSFGFDQRAQHYTVVSSNEQLLEAVEHAHSHSWPIFILGGGSNIVLTQDISGLVIHMAGTQIKRTINPVDGGEKLRVAAGKNWHELVLQTLDMGLPGLENLSLIPGTVGAAPVQNIGAYGVEVKDRITLVHALHLPSRQWCEFTTHDCNFSYRHSLFKDHPKEYAITEVEFELGSRCETNTSYESLAKHLTDRELSSPSAIEISQSVVAIRQSKLPDPNVIGNAGSFFHNPIVSVEDAELLKKRFPGLVVFSVNEETAKLAAGWMIDQLGYKGLSRNGVGVYEHQALVLVHTGGANGAALLALANEIISRVKDTYDVGLSIEPLVI